MAATGIIIDERLPGERKQQIIEHALPLRIPLLSLTDTGPETNLATGQEHELVTVWALRRNASPDEMQSVLTDFLNANAVLVPVVTDPVETD